MDHAAEARDRFSTVTMYSDSSDAVPLALVGIGHTLLLIAERMPAPRDVEAEEAAIGLKADELTGAVEAVADAVGDLPVDRIREELADLNAHLRSRK